jgi:membrane protease subunit HflC
MNYKNIGLGALLLAIITGASSIFIVEQTEQAMVLAFGEPKRVIKTPGLNYKIP